MSDVNPIDRLTVIAEELRTGRGNTENAAWLLAAIRRHVTAGESLDRALGLAGALGRSPRFAYLRDERNRILRRALDLCAGDVQRLAEEIDRFERRVWPAWRYRDELPPEWPPLRIHLHAAFRLGIALPKTTKGLRQALGN